MKINSIGINAYRQTVTENQKRIPTPGENAAAKAADRVLIPGQEDSISSKLAVQLQRGKFADMLTPEERQALELIFEKFRLAGLGDEHYGQKAVQKSEHLGKVVDVKL